MYFEQFTIFWTSSKPFGIRNHYRIFISLPENSQKYRINGSTQKERQCAKNISASLALNRIVKSNKFVLAPHILLERKKKEKKKGRYVPELFFPCSNETKVLPVNII